LRSGRTPLPASPGSDELTPEARAQLDELARALGRDELRAYRFAIAGHTDAAGGEGYNEALSRRRAVSVVSYLARAHGIPAERLAAIGYGETQLADPQDPTSGRNRRVEVRTVRQEP
jgi:OmpA-OmpF porin, OOP family